MNTLKKMNELDKYNVYGLYQICSFNRDHLHGYSRMLRNEIIDLIENVFYEKKIINIPPYVLNNKDYLKKVYKLI